MAKTEWEEGYHLWIYLDCKLDNVDYSIYEKLSDEFSDMFLDDYSSSFDTEKEIKDYQKKAFDSIMKSPKYKEMVAKLPEGYSASLYIEVADQGDYDPLILADKTGMSKDEIQKFNENSFALHIDNQKSALSTKETKEQVLINKDVYEKMKKYLSYYESDIEYIISDSEDRFNNAGEEGDISDPDVRENWEDLSYYDGLKEEVSKLNDQLLKDESISKTINKDREGR